MAAGCDRIAFGDLRSRTARLNGGGRLRGRIEGDQSHAGAWPAGAKLQDHVAANGQSPRDRQFDQRQSGLDEQQTGFILADDLATQILVRR